MYMLRKRNGDRYYEVKGYTSEKSQILSCKKKRHADLNSVDNNFYKKIYCCSLKILNSLKSFDAFFPNI